MNIKLRLLISAVLITTFLLYIGAVIGTLACLLFLFISITGESNVWFSAIISFIYACITLTMANVSLDLYESLRS